MKNNPQPLPLLLDTHVWIWALEQREDKLSAAVLQTLDQASLSETGVIYVSSISVWEVGMLVAKKRITLSADPLVWVHRALLAPGIQLVPLVPEIAILTTRLPNTRHKDPADHMLIATAQQLGARLVSCDSTILTYAAEEQACAVLDARPSVHASLADRLT